MRKTKTFLFKVNHSYPIYSIRNHTKFKIIPYFFVKKFLSQSIKCGKKTRFFTLYTYHYYSKFLNKFYKADTTFIIKKPRIDYSYNTELYYLNVIPHVWQLNYAINNFFKYNKFILTFYVEKRKTFINHKKKYFDIISYNFVNTKNENHIFFKFLKITFLNKKYKKNLLPFVRYDLFAFSESIFMCIFKNMIFDIISKKLN